MARVATGAAPESRNRLMIVAALIFAGLAAVLAFVTLQNAQGGGDGPAAVDTTYVVVAAQDIGVNTLITEDMVEVRSIPLDQALGGVYSSIEATIGLPVRYPLQRGEQVTAAKVGLEAIGEEKDLALVLEQGMRAFAIEATEVTAVGGLLLPGNFVDVIAVYGNDEEKTFLAETVLQHIEVLGVAQEAVEPVPATSSGEEGAGDAAGIRSQRPDEVERQPRARSVTLAVTPEQAQLLAGLQSQNENKVELWLSLRPIDDSNIESLDDTPFVPFRLFPPQ